MATLRTSTPGFRLSRFNGNGHKFHLTVFNLQTNLTAHIDRHPRDAASEARLAHSIATYGDLREKKDETPKKTAA